MKTVLVPLLLPRACYHVPADTDDLQAGHSGPMAPQGISAVLDMEISTATFRIMYVFVILHHERREIVHFNATYHPTAQWTAQQIVEAFPFDTAPRYLIRDRDSICGGS